MRALKEGQAEYACDYEIEVERESRVDEVAAQIFDQFK